MGERRFGVRVKPGASRTFVGGSYGEPAALIVSVNAPAVDGRANDAVIAALAEAFGLRPQAVTIVAGHASRTKTVRITTDDPVAIDARLRALLDTH